MFEGKVEWGEQMIKLYLTKLFSIVFSISMGWIFLNVVFTSTSNPLLALILAGIIFFILYGLLKFHAYIVTKMKDSIIIIILCIFFVLVFIIQTILGYYLQIDCNVGSWDFDQIYRNAISYAATGSISNPIYFMRYPHNSFIAYLLAIYYRMIYAIFGTYTEMAGVILNIIFIDTTIIFVFLIAKRLWNYSLALYTALLCFLFSPFYLYVPIFYTDTLALPFTVIPIYLYLIFIQIKNKKWYHSFLPIVMGVILGIGMECKATIGIVTVAILIHAFLSYGAVFTGKVITLCIVGLSVTITLISISFSLVHFVESKDKDYYEYPYTHWIMMGLAEDGDTPGGYSSTDDYLTRIQETKADKKAFNEKEIIRRLHEYGVSGLMIHLRTKAVDTWGDGTFYAPVKLKRTPKYQTKLWSYVFPDGKNFSYVLYYSQAFWIVIYFFMLLSVHLGIRHNSVDFILLLKLAIFGLFLFLLLWEARSRYLVHCLPLIILTAVDGMLRFNQKYCSKKDR